MKHRIWILCVVILVVCLVSLLHKVTQHQKTDLVGPDVTNADQTGQTESPKTGQSADAPNTSNVATVSPKVTSPGPHPENANDGNPQILKLWQSPIEFYGKVVDENSNAVAGAKIRFQWVEAPRREGNRTSNTESDEKGLFSLHDARGPSLGVSVSKEGYYTSRRGNDSFSYGSLANEPFSPDPLNPVIFSLKGKGIQESLIKTDFPVGIGQIAQLRHDGTPVEIDLLNGVKVSGGNSGLRLEFWRDISDKKANVFDWKLQLSIANGGLIPTDEEFAFQAPENGYQPAIVINMPATNQPWLGESRSRYYLRLPDGKYGRIDVYLLPYNGVFSVQSAVNPSGSRNLEPSN
jgi:hypothetical protein